MSDTTRIFVSHSSKYRELAKCLKVSLQALESDRKLLDVLISEEMAGATEWRKWIEDNVRGSDIFILLYPHAGMEMSWCNFELGRFCDLGRSVVCIKNPDIPKPPPAFEPYQAYNSNVAEIMKFFRELFVSGELVGRALNPEVGKVSSELHKRALDLAKEIEQQFAAARVLEHFYERRLTIDLSYDEAHQFSADKTTIQGNKAGFNVLGLDDASSIPVKWADVRKHLGDNGLWLDELLQAMQLVPAGVLPPPLPPFRSAFGIYLPLVVKAESVDGVLKNLVVILLTADPERLIPLLGWSMPKSAPAAPKYLLRLVRMIFHARWEILEPRYQELKYGSGNADRCAEIARSVTSDYDRLQKSFATEGANGLDEFFSNFERALRPEVNACIQEWMDLTGALRENDNPDQHMLVASLRALLTNNRKWLELAGQQFMHIVSDFDDAAESDALFSRPMANVSRNAQPETTGGA